MVIFLLQMKDSFKDQQQHFKTYQSRQQKLTIMHTIEQLSTITQDDFIPSVLIYSTLLDRAQERFKISRDEARRRYGLLTVSQWQDLLQDNKQEPEKNKFLQSRLQSISGQRFMSLNHLQDLLRGLLSTPELFLKPLTRHNAVAINHEIEGQIFNSGEPTDSFLISFIYDNGSMLYITDTQIV